MKRVDKGLWPILSSTFSKVMVRFVLEIMYDGTNYAGWQKQPNTKTVQSEIESALQIILREPISIMGSGRTDAGVHAQQQFAHFDANATIPDVHKFLRSLRGLLPRDIFVMNIREANDEFHVRFDAKFRQYRYQFSNYDDVFSEKYTWVILKELDILAMKECAQLLHGTHDFASFSKFNAEVANTRCEILASEIVMIDEGRWHYRIRANRFLHHMVRSLVGGMIQVGTGKIVLQEFERRLNEPDNANFSFVAPAKALFLEEVVY